MIINAMPKTNTIECAINEKMTFNARPKNNMIRYAINEEYAIFVKYDY